MASGHLRTIALDIEDGGIAAPYVTRNPDRLRHVHYGPRPISWQR